MNILIYSTCGEGVMLIPTLREEGHDVLLYLADKSNLWDGQVFKTENPEAAAAQADLIIFDDNGSGHVADRWRAKGYKVWNGGRFAEKLEYDRKHGMKVFADHGIPIPETWEVSSVQEIEALVKTELKKEKRAVVKIDGEDGAGSSLSFVADDLDQLIENVHHWEDDGRLPSSWSGIIQKFVPGIEVSTEGWFDGKNFHNINITMEQKKILTGENGPPCGCSANVIACIKPSSRLFKLVLEPLRGFLEKNGYVGQIDTNAIVDERGVPHALEFTPRCGYDATPTLAYGWGYGNLIGRLLEITDGHEDPTPKGKYAAGVRVYVPPYPFESKVEELSRKVYETCYGVPVENHDVVAERFYLYDTLRNEKGDLVIGGNCGIVGVALGADDDPHEAGEKAYRVAETLKVPHKSYRAVDAFRRARKDLPRLISHGLINLS